MRSVDAVAGGVVALGYFASYVLTELEGQMTAYDAIISEPGRLGHHSRDGWRYRNESCHHRTRTLRRHLRQYRLYTHKNAGRERLRRPPRAPRSRVNSD